MDQFFLAEEDKEQQQPNNIRTTTNKSQKDVGLNEKARYNIIVLLKISYKDLSIEFGMGYAFSLCFSHPHLGVYVKSGVKHIPPTPIFLLAWVVSVPSLLSLFPPSGLH